MKNTTHKILLATAVLASAAMTSCDGDKGWSVKGHIDGLSDGTRLAIEASNGRSWYVLDSISADADGSFSYSSAEPSAYADILRLTLPGKGSIYFPVNGKEKITVEAPAATFGTGHRLSGTDMAETVSAIDSIVASTDDIAELQRKLTGFVTTDTTGIIAFYAVGKAKGSRPVFDPAESMGNRVYGAAAQVFATYHPDDRRGETLKNTFFEGKRAMGRLPQQTNVVEVPETGIIDIVRYDNKGTEHSLAKLAQENKVILLSFTDYTTQVSPAYNAKLYDLYTKYKDKGLQIYQLAFDSDEVEWKEAARNLPWITVWNSPTDGGNVLIQYNCGAVPLTYIINNGDIAARIENPADIEKTLAKYF